MNFSEVPSMKTLTAVFESFLNAFSASFISLENGKLIDTILTLAISLHGNNEKLKAQYLVALWKNLADESIQEVIPQLTVSHNIRKMKPTSFYANILAKCFAESQKILSQSDDQKHLHFIQCAGLIDRSIMISDYPHAKFADVIYTKGQEGKSTIISVKIPGTPITAKVLEVQKHVVEVSLEELFGENNESILFKEEISLDDIFGEENIVSYEIPIEELFSVRNIPSTVEKEEISLDELFGEEEDDESCHNDAMKVPEDVLNCFDDSEEDLSESDLLEDIWGIVGKKVDPLLRDDEISDYEPDEAKNQVEDDYFFTTQEKDEFWDSIVENSFGPINETIGVGNKNVKQTVITLKTPVHRREGRLKAPLIKRNSNFTVVDEEEPLEKPREKGEETEDFPKVLTKKETPIKIGRFTVPANYCGFRI